MRMHISVAVEDIPEAIKFYSTLFNQSPTIVREDYAKWMVEDPKINFAVDKRCGGSGVDHLGIQAENQDELDSLARRMQQAGQSYLDVDKTHCCYANMDKAWTKGLGGEKWEGFLTHDQDEKHYGDDSSPNLDKKCC